MRPSVTRHIFDESYLFPHSFSQAWIDYFDEIHGHGNSWAGIFIAIRMQVLKALLIFVDKRFMSPVSRHYLTVSLARYFLPMTLFIIYDTIKYLVSITYWLNKSNFAENRTIRYVIAMRLVEVSYHYTLKIERFANNVSNTPLRCVGAQSTTITPILLFSWSNDGLRLIPVITLVN